MNEQELGKEIARFLDFGADKTIKQSTLYRLQSARRAALENCQPELKIINSGDGTSVYGGHGEDFNPGKLVLLLLVLFAFALVSATYWQFLEKNKPSIDTTILVDDVSIDAHIDNEHELDDDLSIDAYIDNVLQLVDDLSADAENASEPERELVDDMPMDVRIDNESELVDDMPTDTHIDNELHEWLDSN